jgi:hypothetical protein
MQKLTSLLSETVVINFPFWGVVTAQDKNWCKFPFFFFPIFAFHSQSAGETWPKTLFFCLHNDLHHLKIRLTGFIPV